MDNPLQERMFRRQKARRLDTAQRFAMKAFIAFVVLFSLYELGVALSG